MKQPPPRLVTLITINQEGHYFYCKISKLFAKFELFMLQMTILPVLNPITANANDFDLSSVNSSSLFPSYYLLLSNTI